MSARVELEIIDDDILERVCGADGTVPQWVVDEYDNVTGVLISEVSRHSPPAGELAAKGGGAGRLILTSLP